MEDLDVTLTGNPDIDSDEGWDTAPDSDAARWHPGLLDGLA